MTKEEDLLQLEQRLQEVALEAAEIIAAIERLEGGALERLKKRGINLPPPPERTRPLPRRTRKA